MNARSPVWEVPAARVRTDQRGKIFEEVLTEQNVSLINDRTPTHYHVQTNKYSVIDLTICSSDALLDFEYSVVENLYDSDHYPVKVKLVSNTNIVERPERYKVEKADWQIFEQLTETNWNIPNDMGVDEIHDTISQIIKQAAEQTIPKSTNNITKPPVPWFNNECKKALADRNKAERALKRQYTVENKIRYNRNRAKCRYVFNNAKRKCWKEYVSSINQYTTLNKIWKKIKKYLVNFHLLPARFSVMITTE